MDEQEIKLELEENTPEVEEQAPEVEEILEDVVEDVEEDAKKIVDQLKEAVKKGNVARIFIKKNDETILNLPLNIGILGTFIGAVAAPWALVIATITTIGLDCKVQIAKTDGSIIDISGKKVGEKLQKAGTAIVEDVKDAFKD